MLFGSCDPEGVLEPPVVVDVRVSLSEPQVVARQTISATVTMRESTGQTLPNELGEVVVRSSNTNVATVRTIGSGANQSLEVRGVAPGVATITVNALGREGSADVTVIPAVDIVRISPDSLLLDKDSSRTITVATLRSSGESITERSVVYRMGDNTIAGVTPASGTRSATIVAREPGVTQLIAEIDDRADTITVDVIVDRTLTVRGMASGGSGTITSTPAGIACAITDGVAATTGCTATFKSNVSVQLAATPAIGQMVHAWQNLPATGPTNVPGDSGRLGSPAEPDGCAATDLFAPPASCTLSMRHQRLVGVSFYAAPVTVLNETFSDTYKTDPAWVARFGEGGSSSFRIANNALTIDRSLATVTGPALLSVATNIPVSANTQLRLDVKPNSATSPGGVSHPGRAVVVVRNADSSLTRIHYHFGNFVGTAPAETPTDRYQYTAMMFGVWHTGQSFQIRSKAPNAVRVVRVHLGGSGTNFSADYDNVRIYEAPAALRLIPDTATVGIGATRSLSPIALSALGDTLTGLNFGWSSLDPSFATVSSTTGVITGVNAGTARIVASVDDVADTAVVTVRPSRAITIVGMRTGGGGTVTSNPTGLSCTISSLGFESGTCTANFAEAFPVTLTATPASGGAVHGWQNSPSFFSVAGGVGGSTGSPPQIPSCARNADGDAPAACTFTVSGSRTVGASFYAAADTAFSEFVSDNQITTSPSWVVMLPDSASGSASGTNNRVNISQNIVAGASARRTTSLSLATNVRVTRSTQFRAQANLFSSTANTGSAYPARIVLVTANAAGATSRIHYLFAPTAGTLPSNTATDRYVFTAVPYNAASGVVAFRIHDVDSTAVTVRRIHLGGEGQAVSVWYDDLQLVDAAGRIDITPGSPALTAGDSVQLAATVVGVGGDTITGRSITWASSDASIATVSSTGLVRAVAGGLATITASDALGATGSVFVNVISDRTLTIQGILGGGSGTVVSSPAGINCTIADGAAATSGCTATFSSAVDVTLTATGIGGASVHSWQALSTYSLISGGLDVRGDVQGMPPACSASATSTAPSSCTLRALTNRTIGVAWNAPIVNDFVETFNRASFVGGLGWVPQASDSGTLRYITTSNALRIQRHGAFDNSRRDAALSVLTNVAVSSALEWRMDARVGSSEALGGVNQPVRALLDLVRSDSSRTRLHILVGPSQGSLPANTSADVYHFTPYNSSSFASFRVRLRAHVPDAVAVRRVTLGGSGTWFEGEYDNLYFTAPVDTVRLSRDTLTLSPNNGFTPTAVLKGADGSTITNVTPSWSSTNTSVATVSASGVITAVNVGTAFIIASAEGRADTLSLSVVAGVALTVVSGGSGGVGTVTSSPTGINCTINASSNNGTCVAAFPPNAGVVLTLTPSVGHRVAAWRDGLTTTSASGGRSGSATTYAVSTNCAADADGIAPTTCTVPMSQARSIGVSIFAAPLTALSESFDDFSLLSNPSWTTIFPVGGTSSATVQTSGGSPAALLTRSGAGSTTGEFRIGLATNLSVTAATDLRLDVMAESEAIASGGASSREYPARVTVYLRNADSSRVRLHYYYSFSGGNTPTNTANDLYTLITVTAGEWNRGLRYRLRTSAPNAVLVERVELSGAGWDFASRFDNLSIIEAVQAVKLTPDTLSLLKDRSGQLTATLLGAIADTLSGRSISWVSSDTLVARVNASGLVTAIDSGTATISASSESVTGVATVIVSPIRLLTLTGTGSGGSGFVTSQPAGISCAYANGVPGATGCSATFAKNATVTLTATPAGGHALKAWQGGTTFSSISGGVSGRNAASSGIEAECRWTDSLGAPSTCAVSLTTARSIGVTWYTPAASALSESFTDGNFTANPTWSTHYPDSGTTAFSVTSGELTIARTGSSGFASAAYLSTALSIPITASTELRLDALATSASVEGGSPANQYPTRAIVAMTTADGAPRRLHLYFGSTNGGLPSDTETDKHEYRPVTLTEWARGERFNLRARFSDAATLRRIHLGGAGTDFSGSYDNIIAIEAVTDVAVTPDSMLLAVAATQQLTASLTDAAGNTLTGRSVSWSTLDAAIATVSSSGLVTAVGNGRTGVVATSEGVSDTVIVEVGTLQRLTLVGIGAGGSGTVTSSPAGLTCTITDGVAAGSGCSTRFAAGSTVTLTASAGVQFWGNNPGITSSQPSLAIVIDSAAQVAGCAVDASFGAATTCAVPLAADRTVGIGFNTTAVGSLSEQFDDGDFRNDPSWSPIVGDSGSTTFSVVDGALRVQRSADGGARRAARLSLVTNIPVTTNSELRLDVRPVSASVVGDSAYPAQAVVVVQNADLSTTRIVYSFSPSNVGLPTSTATDQYAHGVAPLGTWSRGFRFNIRALAPNASVIRRVLLGGRGADFEAMFDSVMVIDAVASVTVTPSTPSIPNGSTIQMFAVMRNTNGDSLVGRSVAWSSSNTSVATVSAVGLVTAVGVGSATITATSEGVNGSTVVTVTTPRTLTISSVRSGGSGTITSSPAGINCSITAGIPAASGCSAVFNDGATVQLTSNPEAGNTLAYWLNTPSVTTTASGVTGSTGFPMTISGCDPDGAGVWPTTCSVSMTANRTVGAAWLAPAVTSLAESFADGNITASPAWTPILPDGGSTTVDIVDGALRVVRTGSGGAGRGVDLAIQSDIPVSTSTELRLDVRAVSSELTAGGTGDEYPARVILTVRNADNSFTRLHYYFTASGGTAPANTATNRYVVTSVPADAWATGLRFNLRALWSSAVAVTRVSLGGGGWDYDGRYDNVRFEEAVATVQVTPTADTLQPGGTAQLTATLRDSASNVLNDRVVQWSSSNTGIATVSSSGLVTAVGNGTATVTASVEGKSAAATILVITETEIFSDDFNGTLSNWVERGTGGTWTTGSSELVGTYDIGCGSTTCSQTTLLPADAFQPTSTRWRATQRFSYIRNNYGPGYDLHYSFGWIALWVSDTEKQVITLGAGTANTDLPSTVNYVALGHQRGMPWQNILGSGDTVSTATWTTTDWQTLALERDGNTYRLYFNDVLVYTFDWTFSAPPKVGVHVYGKARFDSFRIVELP